jgi:hypothetical protein
MKARLSRIAICALTLTASLTAFQDGKIRYRWTKGDTARYQIVQQNNSTISGLPGGMGDIAIEQTSAQVMRSVVEDVAADGTATLRETLESMRMEMNSAMFSMKYDSANPAAATDPMSSMVKDMIAPIIGAQFTVVRAPSGDVTKFEGMSALADKMFKANPPDPSTAGLIDGLKASLSDEGMRSLFGQIFAQFPNRALKVGDTWDVKVTTPNPMLGGIITTVSSTLKAIESEGGAQIARVATTVTVDQDMSKPAAPNPMGFSVKMTKGNGEGEQVFDMTSGKLRRSILRTTSPMSMAGAGPDGSAMALSMTNKSTVTVELVEK